VDEPNLAAIVQQLVHDRPATSLFGLMCLVSGLAVVLGHQIWSGGIAPILGRLAAAAARGGTTCSSRWRVRLWGLAGCILPAQRRLVQD
jgi:glycine/D-amino acid oxidase-like deaminating enzyme